mmetsp:Transcript_18750/g.59508  ORF Transcript_18750/g.59508 Transcript_18750/m.59508 type:complete len:133 (-) Transcript_18750:177-575(-)
MGAPDGRTVILPAQATSAPAGMEERPAPPVLLQGYAAPHGQVLPQHPPVLGHIIYGPTQVRSAPDPSATYQVLPQAVAPQVQGYMVAPGQAQVSPSQGYAPPPQLPPKLQQVIELTPPPPMQSPKLRQAPLH